ncbi:NUDIX hydrolase [Aminobacter sp. NyZ550]|jgi:8-oxo-dGTP pyrophosphatase MutT (NUDIX family)|uniref:8-oxo-dGTP pyrophosphatase MutT (NUDIX family) n=1 Tax=Aminobacter ciceronei TaxID=150723 RepID=A0ABR6C3J7_9HYPH|nr:MULTISPECIES: NUDIX hydrolase [Aminobacter]WMC96273.1 NUDIX hydrolase [Aminobacter aminovorans]MBA8905776.1 8-oxo-dGTP pyrophosphatase MutT (NUDIX family) [Aminobacter ciceronei]MBA9019555.1 8-oxo-dGTP pyrophosphatase MutT (NUDIX family) [Aminobacter ciceronei]MRX34397.1 NUDIX domain-containing protein [Aminobacter sp. MDW-2]QNH35996.1 NUDIX hydrolase [Aminobacter sp. MDW-2]
MPKDKKTIRKASKGERIAQVAAIPFRVNEGGELQVMLVTSRGTRRFIVPKGWPMKGKSGRQAALIEAREEAGVRGKALKKPAGSYCYWKRLSTSFVHVVVTAYLIEVTEELEAWQEAGARQRAWLTPTDAAVLIDEPELSTLIRNLTLADLLQPEPVAA